MKRKTADFSAALHRNISQFALGRSSALPHFLLHFSVDIFSLENAFTQFIIQNQIYFELFHNLPNNYPPSNKKLLMQAIINLNYYVESEDYSQYVFPALKALEGHIKYLITIATNNPVPRHFNCFNKDKSTNSYVYVGVGNSLIKTQIENCYNYYKSQRDTLFHFGDIMGSVDNTRVINNKDEADEIINECFNLINQ